MEIGAAKNAPTLDALFRYAATLGNAVFFLWFFYNGVDSGFVATRLEAVGWIALFALLAFNVVVLVTPHPRLRDIGVIGNGMGVLGILYNVYAWGVGASLIQVFSHLGILALLILNMVLLSPRWRRKTVAPSA